MTRRTLAVAVIGFVAVAVAATAAALPARRSLARSVIRSGPTTPRIRVQVLNATRTRGLGRRAMLYLRDQGFDVVEVGTSAIARDTTLVLDRSRHPEWARNVATSLGEARVESRPDSSRYLDVTVLVGSSWRPPAQPFYP
ncbi:MAG TPA: LytR C-terminal domain-containing protein [Gemmatimonadaceae bacterium]|nr:LytR C-terminal domain-containing protein [Gemmatimonadaceae bacterium]